MKPATVRREFIPFQQLMNICSALVVTALWSVVLWVQRRAQLIMLISQVQPASAQIKTETEQREEKKI